MFYVRLGECQENLLGDLLSFFLNFDLLIILNDKLYLEENLILYFLYLYSFPYLLAIPISFIHATSIGPSFFCVTLTSCDCIYFKPSASKFFPYLWKILYAARIKVEHKVQCSTLNLRSAPCFRLSIYIELPFFFFFFFQFFSFQFLFLFFKIFFC
jgi:hypothetical protein